MTFFSSRFLFSENSSGCTRWNRESGFSQLQVRWRRRVLTPAQSPWRSCRSSGGAEGHTGPRCPPSNGPCPWRGACSLGAAFPSPLTESGRARGGPPPAGVHQEGHPNEVVPCHLRATRLGSLHGGRGIPSESAGGGGAVTACRRWRPASEPGSPHGALLCGGGSVKGSDPRPSCVPQSGGGVAPADPRGVNADPGGAARGDGGGWGTGELVPAEPAAGRHPKAGRGQGPASPQAHLTRGSLIPHVCGSASSPLEGRWAMHGRGHFNLWGGLHKSHFSRKVCLSRAQGRLGGPFWETAFRVAVGVSGWTTNPT